MTPPVLNCDSCCNPSDSATTIEINRITDDIVNIDFKLQITTINASNEEEKGLRDCLFLIRTNTGNETEETTNATTEVIIAAPFPIGIVIGTVIGVIFLTALAILLWCCFKRHRKEAEAEEEEHFGEEVPISLHGISQEEKLDIPDTKVDHISDISSELGDEIHKKEIVEEMPVTIEETKIEKKESIPEPVIVSEKESVIEEILPEIEIFPEKETVIEEIEPELEILIAEEEIVSPNGLELEDIVPEIEQKPLEVITLKIEQNQLKTAPDRDVKSPSKSTIHSGSHTSHLSLTL